MSFILDALKKVDAKKRFGDDAAAGELARSTAARKRRGRELLFIGAVGVGSAAVTAGTLVFLWMQSGSAGPPAPGESPPPAAATPLPDTVLPEVPAPETPARTHVTKDLPRAVLPPQRSAPAAAARSERVDVPDVVDEEAEDLSEDVPSPAVRLVGRPQPSAATTTAPSSPEPPPSAPSVERPDLVLQGTSVLDGRPVAVISDRRVFEGDFIEGVRVLRIDERSVTLELDGERFTLTF